MIWPSLWWSVVSTTKPGPMRRFDSKSTHEVIQMYFMEGLPETGRCFRHVFTMIDRFSLKLEMEPARSTTAIESARLLSKC